MIATTLMDHAAKVAITIDLATKTTFTSPKIKNRNGFPEKRITDFDHTLEEKACQRDSAKP
jgi:hypothetical protein